MTDPAALIIPFGRHRGTTVAELLAKDPSYAEWLAAQGWLATRFAELHQAILTRGAAPDDSPEHNAIQVRFLDPTFQIATIQLVEPGRLAEIHRRMAADDDNMRAKTIKVAEDEVNRSAGYGTGEWAEKSRAKAAGLLQVALAVIPKKFKLVVKVSFEKDGLDVLLNASYIVDGRECLPEFYPVTQTIEIKPTLGDDFPSVMRQMRRLNAKLLVIREYNGRTVSFADLRRMFEANSQKIVTVREIEAEIPNVRTFAGEAAT